MMFYSTISLNLLTNGFFKADFLTGDVDGTKPDDDS